MPASNTMRRRRHVAVEAQDGFAGLVEKQQAGGELDFLRRAVGLLRVAFAVQSHDFAVAPDVDRDHVELFLHRGLDLALRQIALHQRRAIRAAVLGEHQDDALAMGARLVDVLLQVQEAVLEPGGILSRPGAVVGAHLGRRNRLCGVQ